MQMTIVEDYALAAFMRHLPWDACYNVRDIGGYETRDGRQTRWRAIVRADNLCRLSAAGQEALIDYGVRTIVDLRGAGELTMDPNPFAVERSRGDWVTYLNMRLLDEEDLEGKAKLAAATTMQEAYLLVVERARRSFAEVMTAIARAPEGGVLVHCHAGKDRTGVVIALLLALAGVPAETIAADYAWSDRCLQPLYRRLMEQSQDPVERERLSRELQCPPEAMLAVLSWLETAGGGIERYLLDSGMTPDDLECLRLRLLAPE